MAAKESDAVSDTTATQAAEHSRSQCKRRKHEGALVDHDALSPWDFLDGKASFNAKFNLPMFSKKIMVIHHEPEVHVQQN